MTQKKASVGICNPVLLSIRNINPEKFSPGKKINDASTLIIFYKLLLMLMAVVFRFENVLQKDLLNCVQLRRATEGFPLKGRTGGSTWVLR